MNDGDLLPVRGSEFVENVPGKFHLFPNLSVWSKIDNFLNKRQFEKLKYLGTMLPDSVSVFFFFFKATNQVTPIIFFAASVVALRRFPFCLLIHIKIWSLDY